MRNSNGSIRKIEQNKWRVCIELGRDPQTGKRQRIDKTVRGSKKQASEQLFALQVKYGKLDTSLSITLDIFFENVYLPACEERLRPNTTEGYKQKYAQFIAPVLGGYQLINITPAMINKLLQDIEGNCRKLQAYKTLRQILNKAVRLDLLQRNPCSNVEPPKTETYKPQVLTLEECKIYLQHFKNTEVETAVLIAIGAGLRRSEICALKWQDIKDGSISITSAVTSVHGKPHKDAPKSQFGVRTVYLPPSINARLEQLRQADSIAVVTDTAGNPINPDNLSHRYEKIRNTLPANIQKISLKNLRHTSLTLALEGGADLLAVSRRGGHSSPNITARYYLRPSENIDKSAAAGIDNLLQ